MRIGLFTDTYPPFVNGVSTSVSMLKKALEKKGHQVLVVTVNNENMKYKFEENNTVVRIPGIPTGIYDYRLTGIYPIKAINIIKKWNLDVIHSHTEFGIGTFARIIAKQLDIPLIHTYHTMYQDYIHHLTHGYFDKPGNKIVEYLAMFYCDKTANELIVPTKKTYDLFKENYNCDKNIHIIPTGIDIEKFYTENVDNNRIRELKKKYLLLKDDFTIVFVGRIGKEKNIDLLIEAQRELVKKQDNIKLILIGDGPDLERYKKMVKKYKIENNVIFVGKVPWVEIAYYYHLGDVFATASQFETQGLTVVEAMASSVAPICIDDESFRNTVIDNLNGRIFKDKKGYIKDVLELYNDHEKLKNLAKQARINAETYSSKYYAERVLDVYRNAIGNKKQRFHLKSIFNVFRRKK